jgi:hypothetical protein
MRLLAISLARVSVFTDIYEWNPQNKIPFDEFCKAFVERYRFLKSPQALEDYDLQKGVVFGAGKINTISIDTVTLFMKGVVIDTRSSTVDAEHFLTDATEWAEEFFGVEHSPDRLGRKVFLSELSFYSEALFGLLNPKFQHIATRLGEVVTHYAREPQTFAPFGISFNIDPPTRLGALNLRIERLAGNPFWENKYFSSAPLPTGEHFSLLAEFESILKA